MKCMFHTGDIYLMWDLNPYGCGDVTYHCDVPLPYLLCYFLLFLMLQQHLEMFYAARQAVKTGFALVQIGPSVEFCMGV